MIIQKATVLNYVNMNKNKLISQIECCMCCHLYNCRFCQKPKRLHCSASLVSEVCNKPVSSFRMCKLHLPMFYKIVIYPLNVSFYETVIITLFHTKKYFKERVKVS